MGELALGFLIIAVGFLLWRLASSEWLAERHVARLLRRHARAFARRNDKQLRRRASDQRRRRAAAERVRRRYADPWDAVRERFRGGSHNPEP